MLKKFAYGLLVTSLTFLPLSTASAKCPDRAKRYIPIIKEELCKYWNSLCPKEVIPAQIEKESSWRVRAERKVGREYGFGLSQITIVRGRFNNFLIAKQKWKEELKNWTWKDRFNPTFHIRYMILYDKTLYSHMGFATNNFERLAFTLSAYNGGLGWILKDRKVAKLRGLNPDKWFCNVELVNSGRSKFAYKVNRYYVRSILLHKIFKYRDCFDEQTHTTHKGGN